MQESRLKVPHARRPVGFTVQVVMHFASEYCHSLCRWFVAERLEDFGRLMDQRKSGNKIVRLGLLDVSTFSEFIRTLACVRSSRSDVCRGLGTTSGRTSLTRLSANLSVRAGQSEDTAETI